ncbi:hypothetical protein [Mucilaginibacter sp. OK098]|uniref:hypothetical protein n=1 Tax=Mucilaginibacter sp. OK098 TaxID=1855297 RepID=UPI000918112F|nr:hypothetical protein [Mucilaginibacter sp. OK098]SHN08766.1 hypothetical protein SAMN05216524_105120 [Mucilaginibacter sp. OK098]
MIVTVNLQTEEQEKILMEFTDRMNFDYQSDDDNKFSLTESQKQEVIRRDNDFINSQTTARDWNDIKRDLKNVYR